MSFFDVVFLSEILKVGFFFGNIDGISVSFFIENSRFFGYFFSFFHFSKSSFFNYFANKIVIFLTFTNFYDTPLTTCYYIIFIIFLHIFLFLHYIVETDHLIWPVVTYLCSLSRPFQKYWQNILIPYLSRLLYFTKIKVQFIACI